MATAEAFRSAAERALEDKRALLICGGTAAERRVIAESFKEKGHPNPTLRAPISRDPSHLTAEVPALVAHLLHVPTSVCEDTPLLIDVVGEAIAASGVRVVTLHGVGDWLRAGGQVAIDRWIELTDAARFILTAPTNPRYWSGETIDLGPCSLPKFNRLEEAFPDANPHELRALEILDEGPSLVALRTLALAFPSLDVGGALPGLLRSGRAEVDPRGAEIFLSPTESARERFDCVERRRRSSDTCDAWDDALAKSSAACLDDLGDPRSSNTLAMLEAHRAALREAFERRYAANDVKRVMALAPGLLAALAVRGPLDLVLHYASIALDLGSDPSLRVELQCKRALLLRGLSRNREVAPLLCAADDHVDGASPRALGRLAATMAKVATPELASAGLRARALSRVSTLPETDPICAILAEQTRASIAWNSGRAEDALRHHIAVATAVSGRDLATLEILVSLAVSALGAADLDVARRFIDNLENEARLLGRTDLVARALGLSGCVSTLAGDLPLAIERFDASIDGLQKGGFHHFERWPLAHRGFAFLLLGAHDRATRDFDLFVAMTLSLGGSPVFGILGGLLSGSRIARELAPGAVAEAPSYLKSIARILIETDDPSERARMTRELLENEPPPAPPGFYEIEMRLLVAAVSTALRPETRLVDDLLPILRVGRNVDWFQTDGQPRVSLVRMRNLRRVFEGLVKAHEKGQVVSVDKVFELGWPGERAHPSSVGNRVHVTLSRLRSLGLRDWLVFGAAGWRLDPRLRVSFE